MSSNVIVDKDGLTKVAEDVIDLVVKKNHDYGDAWQKYGIFTALIRLNDKLLRVKTLTSGEQALVADEGIKDTLKDIVGYGLLALLKVEHGDIKHYDSHQFSFQEYCDWEKVADMYTDNVDEEDEDVSNE